MHSRLEPLYRHIAALHVQPTPLTVTGMIPALASLIFYAAFYLLGAYELHGRKAAHENMLHRRVLVGAIGVLVLTMIVILDPLDDQADLIPLLCGLTALLGATALLDFEVQMISDLLTALLALGGIVYGWQTQASLVQMWPYFATAAGMGALGAFLAGPYSKWRGRDMLGWGDVKFLAAAGLWLTPLQVPVFLAIAGIVGAIGALIYKARTGRAETPFAPALCLSLWASVVYGLSLPGMNGAD